MAKPTASPIARCLEKPVIPVLWEVPAEMSPLEASSVIFLQGMSVLRLPEILAAFEEGPLARIPIMVHIDLLRGLSNDEAGLEYLASFRRISGIVTVHHHLTMAARHLGLLSIVRLFLQDTRAMERGLRVVDKSRPDAVELLPAVAAIGVADQFERIEIPQIAGGLVRDVQTVRQVLVSGCRAVSITNPAFWSLNKEFPPE